MGIDAVAVGSIMVGVLWMRPIGGILGGFLADKIGRTKTLSIALAGNIACLLLMALLPASAGGKLFFVIVMAAGLTCYATRGTYWSLLGDCRIDESITGTTIGVVSLVGYAPDIVLPLFITQIFNIFGDNGGYNAYFIFTAILGALGILLAMRFGRNAKNYKQKTGNLQ